jgi:3-dehydroquinate synthase
MQKKNIQFSSQKVSFLFDADFSQLAKLADKNRTVLLTDENVFRLHQKKFAGWKSIVIPPGEKYKTQYTVDHVIREMIRLEADRSWVVVGVGGGVVTDIAGFVAATYMRGITFGFVPTSILAMVDASIGGKNGIDVDLYKNLVGTVKQPYFLLYDPGFLKTLPAEEWTNGFAEIVKHACIRDAVLFRALEKNSIHSYQKNRKALSELITRNVMIKARVVQKDEFEKNERRLLNFGHTLGHAVENLYQLPHGHAVAVGMVAASVLSEQYTGFRETARVEAALRRYGLTTSLDFDVRKVLEVIKMDKKKMDRSLHYVLLEKIGRGVIKAIPVSELSKTFYSLERAR